MQNQNYERGVADCKTAKSLDFTSSQRSVLRAQQETLQQGEGNVAGSYSSHFVCSRTCGFEADASPRSRKSTPRSRLASSPRARHESPVLYQSYWQGSTDRKRAKSLALELSSLAREANQESLEQEEGREGGSPREALLARLAAEFEASVKPALHHGMISTAREESPLPEVTKRLSHAGSKSPRFCIVDQPALSASPSELDITPPQSTNTFSDTISDSRSSSSGGAKDVENRQRRKGRAKRKWCSAAAGRSCCGCVCFDGYVSADRHAV